MKGRKPGLQINDLDQKEEINIQLEQNEETRTKKMRNLSGTTLNVPTSKLGMPEGEEEE